MPELSKSKDNLLEVTGVSKTFPGVRALDNIDFTLGHGEIHALMGENGAGKSTLIKVITGVHRKDSGSVRFCGNDFEVNSPKEAADKGMSTVYQEVNLAGNLSVAENIFIGREPMKGPFIDWKTMNQKAREVLGQLDLDIDVTQDLASYSIAIQQMVSIGRAIDISAKVLILDEPTSSLDTAESKRLFQIMQKLRDQGMGIIFITHFLDQVYETADRITVLRNGSFVGNFPTAELTKIKLISHMLGREISESELEQRRHVTELVEDDFDEFCKIESLGFQGILHSCDIRIRKGEILGVAGLLGSGRTEFAKSIFGAMRSPNAVYYFDGKRVKIHRPAQAIEQSFGFCPEDRKAEGIIPDLSIKENIAIPLMARAGVFSRIPSKTIQDITDEYIDKLKIKTPSSNQIIGNLSGGNQQKVILARWLATKPGLLILDEPTRGIDVGAKSEIEKIMGDLRDSGISIIFISSELEEIVRNSDRVVVMRDRHKITELTGDQISEDNIMHVIAEGADHESETVAS